MNRLLTLAIISIALTSCNMKNNDNESACCTAKENCTSARTEIPQGIVKAIDCYVEGGIKASGDAAKPGFAETATMSWYENGKLQSVPIQALFDGFDTWEPTESSYEIINYEVAGDVAMVAIDSKFGEAKFIDMFTLVKDGEDWRIVSKVYHIK